MGKRKEKKKKKKELPFWDKMINPITGFRVTTRDHSPRKKQEKKWF